MNKYSFKFELVLHGLLGLGVTSLVSWIYYTRNICFPVLIILGGNFVVIFGVSW